MNNCNFSKKVWEFCHTNVSRAINPFKIRNFIIDMLKRAFTIILLSFCFFHPMIAQDRWLDGGKWVKLSFNKSGIYKVTFEDLESWGLMPNQVSENNFHLLGIQGEILSSLNPDSVISQSEEIPMQLVLGSDKQWGSGDYFLFYVSSSSGFSVKSSGISHYKNIYTPKTQMMFGFNNRPGKRIAWRESSESPTEFISKSTWTYVHDSDIVNLNAMGRVWLGERLGNETLNRNFSISLPTGIDTVEVQVATGSVIEESAATLITSVNSLKDTLNLSPLSIGTYDTYKYNLRNYRIAVNNQRLDLALRLIRPNSKSSLYLDYFRCTGIREIVFNGTPLVLMDHRWLSMNRAVGIKFQNSTSVPVKFWDISNPMEPQEWKITATGSDNVVVLPADITKSQFIVFDESNVFSPKFEGIVSTSSVFKNNNTPALLIITHESLLEAANRLAEHRRNTQNISVQVLTSQQIYDEFTGGQPDLIALRRCIRWMKTISDRNLGNFKYVTLMGAASYDMLDKISNNTNRVPIYQSFGHSPAIIFCLDEYIVYTEARQGDPEISRSDKLGVSVGRIPARTLEEANGFVDKLIRYDSNKSLGPWRNNIVFTSDDVDQVWESEFVLQSEEYSKFITKNNPSVKINKIYADAFKQMVNGNSERYPEFTNTLNKRMSEGSLFINYQGHGGEKGLGQESLLDIPTIKSWKNEYRMPVLFTATCEFTKYDNPNFQSAGELAVLNPWGGAIASLTTTRLVYVPSNSAINRAFWTQYGFPGPNDPIPTVGDVFQKLKNRPNKTDDDKKFALLGDASMKLAFPEHLILVDSVQEKPVDSFKDTLKAFEIVTIKGHIQERGKSLMAQFDGNLWVTIFDKPTTQFTLDNDNNGSTINFEEQNSVIYNGQVTVNDGRFTLVFVVPKDISYQVGLGKAIFYAHNNNTDATGGWDFLLGSSLKLLSSDTIGPKVNAYLQDTTFISGTAVSENVDFVARIYDENGINATGSGIGRDMVLIIDEGTEQEQNLVVNQYFQYDVNSFTRGTLVVPVSGLTPGRHTFRCKVWDIYNNFGTDNTDGIVTPGRTLTINNHGVYPNPITQQSKLWFSHTLPGEDLEIRWQIVSLTGQILTSGNVLMESSFSSPIINLDGIFPTTTMEINDKSTKVSSGIYFYKIFVSSTDGLQTSVGGKLIYQPTK